MSTNAENPFSLDVQDERERLERIWENYRKETNTFITDGEKNLEAAETLKTEGNLHYSNRDFRKALICYNEALCSAPLDSPLVGILYANRSAVYLESGLPIQCQENIQLALDHGYPADKREKLEERQAKCLEMIEQLPEEAIKHELKPFWTPELCQSAHPKFPFLSKAVDVVIDAAEGPKLVAKADLRPGDVYLIDPYNIRVLDCTRTKDCFARCAFCTLPCYLSLIPCCGCVHVMYCKDCLPKWEKIHKFECKSWDTDSGYTLMARVLVQTLDLYDFDLELLKKDIEEVQKSPKVLLEGDYVNDLNRQIMKWVFPRWNLDSDDLVDRGICASYLLEKLLHVNATFATLVSTREKKITALQVLFSFPANFTHQSCETYMARYIYRPFRSRFFTHDCTIVNSTYSASHFEFNVCLLPVKRGKEINVGTNENLNLNQMPATYEVPKNIIIPGFVPEFEAAKIFKCDLNLRMKDKNRYAEILDKISGHFPCYEVVIVMWFFFIVLKELSEDPEYCLTTGLCPDAKETKMTEETKKIVARILKK